MQLVTPQIGLIFWMVLAFLIVLFILKKFAWKPILGMIHERERSIEEALSSAERAKQEMKALQSSNEKILQEAKNQRDAILKEARDMKDAIIAEAKAGAQTEADKVMKAARENIQNEKMAAVTDLKNQVAKLSVEIAEKILREQLSSDEKQKTLVKNLLEEVNLN